ncbi:site-specific integrase [Achromobacter mucicolens]|uniref:site-specific integrase n=1 Tax=Achromobacter mucicolens TaxID=1389922 RepID=UPI00244A742A|nr:site-specific integrase [Achromobacter mucicolens]MDH0093272.1 site-specific integrase [Achromobacter mucicolens]
MTSAGWAMTRWAWSRLVSASKCTGRVRTSGQVHARRHLAIVEEAKSGSARSVPLNADALAVLQRQIPKAKKYVFESPSRDGVVRKIGQIDARCLRRACAEVGIGDFHRHDLRHTWASWHIQAGTPLMVLKDPGGWETLDMGQRYAHLAPSHLAHHSATVEFWSKSERIEKTPLLRAA